MLLAAPMTITSWPEAIVLVAMFACLAVIGVAVIWKA